MSGFFLHGASYENATGVPRSSACASCAFRSGEGTVRPTGVTVEEVANDTSSCDDFVCHTPDGDGSFPSCAGWHARFRRQA